MDVKTIDKILCWIPFKSLRKELKKFLLSYLDLYNKLKDIKEWNNIKYMEVCDFELLLSFRKEFEKDNDFYKKYIELTHNLDEISINIVNDIFSKVSNYDKIDDPVYFSYEELKNLNKFASNYWSKLIKKNDVYIWGKYILPINSFSEEIFYAKAGLVYLNNVECLKNKNILDIGGSIGETSIVFSEYTNKNVYVFEPFESNYNMIIKTLELNNVNNVIPIRAALGESNEEISIFSDGNVNGSRKIDEEKSEINSVEENINMITLDSYVFENNIEVGLISVDIEGYEENFIMGAINTIKTQKPTLILSIYHNYNQFFNLKHIIESLNLGYRFKIIKHSKPQIITETKLIAECY